MKTKTIIVSGPSGAGKSSFVNRLCQENNHIIDIITYTTRPPRIGESQGNPYYFITRPEFEKKITENYFVEWAMVHNNLYGTPRNQIENAWKNQKTVIIDLDIKGAQTFREKLPEGLKTIFILPPNLEELRQRLLKRGEKSLEHLELRLKNASIEISQAHHFDVQIINDHFESSYQRFKKIIDSWLK